MLDATRSVVLGVGVKRTTFADVARAAGMSRATLYTHFADVDDAVAALLTRELGAVLREALAGVEGAGADGEDSELGRTRLVATVRGVLRSVPEHPLFAKVIELDPEVLVPYLTQRLGRVQAEAMAVVDRLLADGQADGSVREEDPAALAYLVLTTVQGFLVAHRVGEAVVGHDAVVDGVCDLLDRGLAA